MKNLKQILAYNKLFVFIGIFVLLYVILFTKVIKYTSKYDGTENKVTGIITNITLDGNKLTLKIKAKENIIANYYLKTKEEKDNILNLVHIGDKILLRGSLSEPLSNVIPNTFNYKEYLYNKKIFYTFKVEEYEILKRNNYIYKFKDSLFKRIYSSKNSDYYLAFIIGDKSLLSSDIFNTYQKNGISHLLAISGMHINMLVLVISTLIKNKKKELFVTSSFLLFYLFLTGITASILRAILFYILKKLNNIYNLKYSNMHVLILSGYIILLLNPFMLYDLGFIYSFVVCFGIIYYNDLIKGNYFVKLLKLSIITFLFSLPITALINYEINITSIFINLIFVPWISLFLYPFTLISFVLPFLSQVLSILISFTNNLNVFLGKLSIFINIPKMSIVLVILFYLILLTKKKKFMYLLLVIIFVSKISPAFDPNYYVYYLDVGQGDSSLLVSPHSKETILIDTGGKVDFAVEDWKIRNKTYHLSDNTIKFLKSIGITKLSYMIITHGDADHAKESLNIIKNIKIKNIVLNSGSYNTLEENIISTEVNVTNVYKLKYFKIRNINNEIYDNENDNSIVNYITFLNYKLLFMGDASSKVEKYLIEKYNLKNIDILKIGHHGSKYSSSKEFIEKVNPGYSIISVGRNNRYNHPHKEVLDNLKNKKVLRTDQKGTIVFIFKKKKMEINWLLPN